MKTLIKEHEVTNLEREIDSVLSDMSKLERSSDKYTTMAENLERLCKANSYESNREVSNKPVNKDTLAVIAGNLLGIVLILGYEKANIITSKAIGFIIKGRV